MEPRVALIGAILEGKLEDVSSICLKYPMLAEEREAHDLGTLVGIAAREGNPTIVSALLDHGFFVDAVRLPEKSTALTTAIDFDHDEVVELLLRRGAKPNVGRPLIAALNDDIEPARRLKYVRLLVEHGADVNRLYDLYGDANKQFTALDWTDDAAVIAYLREHGAKTAAELKAEPKAGTKHQDGKKTESGFAGEVIAYCEKEFGKVDQRSLIEIVPTGHPVSIHVVKPSGNRKHLTLFTTGLSEKPMHTPKGAEDFSLAELFIQLPGDWQYEDADDPSSSWPVRWLRQIAQYPHENDTWLGGAITIVANDDPPQPLAPNTKLTSLLLIAEKSFVRKDGHTVQLYRMMPIYSDERDLEIRKGAPALMREFDKKSVPFIVDINRPSVAGQSHQNRLTK